MSVTVHERVPGVSGGAQGVQDGTDVNPVVDVRRVLQESNPPYAIREAEQVRGIPY